MASSARAKNDTVFDTGDSEGMRTWISPQRSYHNEEKKTTEYRKICLDFLAVKVKGEKVTLINNTKGCRHGLNGTRGGSCRYLHDACFYYLHEGRPIKSIASGTKRIIHCKNGSSCSKSHNICRNCCYATQRFVPLHKREDCPHRGFYNKLLKENGFKRVKNIYLNSDEETKANHPIIKINKTSSKRSYRREEQYILEKFQKLMEMGNSSKLTKKIAGHDFQLEFTTSWS